MCIKLLTMVMRRAIHTYIRMRVLFKLNWFTYSHGVKSDGKILPSHRGENRVSTRISLHEADHHLRVCMRHLEHILCGRPEEEEGGREGGRDRMGEE